MAGDHREGGAEEMIAELYLRYRESLLLFVLRLTSGDRLLAEDVVQEAMLRAWQSAHVLDRHDNMLPWLATVARRIVIDHYRRRSSRPNEVPQIDADAPTADETERILHEVLVAEAMRDLSPGHRQALVETILRDRTVNQGAKVVGIPLGTMKSRVYYALRALRAALEKRGFRA